jgi:DNA-binding protein HU-beta
MTRDTIIRTIKDQAGISSEQAKLALFAITDLISARLADGGTFTLPDIGEFSAHDTPEHPGRNPRTGEAITIAAQRKVKFRPAAALRRAVNGEGAKAAAD